MPKIILRGDTQRQYAHLCVDEAPADAVVSILKPTRTNAQNAKMWAMLADVSRSKPEGRHWVSDTWKAAFMQYLGHQCQFAEGLDGSGPFPVGFKSSQLNVQQMVDLITVIYQYGDEHGVEWREVKRAGFDPMEESA